MSRVAAFALMFGLVLGFACDPAAQARPLVLGSINADPSAEMKDWLPFARYLAGELAADGITEGKVVVARDSKQMIDFLRTGKVDLYIDSPLIMLEINDAAGSKLLARRWKKGKAEYSAVIFTRKDAGPSSLVDLKNKVIAFEKESSSSGYLLPRLEMQRAGLIVEALAHQAIKPANGHVGYRFSGADRNTVAWVLYGRAAAGATSREDFDDIAEEQRTQLKVIWESAPIPRHAVAHRADLPPTLVARIKSVLFGMDKTEDGRGILKRFERTAKFDEIPKRSLEALSRYDSALRNRLTQ